MLGDGLFHYENEDKLMRDGQCSYDVLHGMEQEEMEQGERLV